MTSSARYGEVCSDANDHSPTSNGLATEVLIDDGPGNSIPVTTKRPNIFIRLFRTVDPLIDKRTCTILLALLIVMAFGISNTVMGFLYRNQCPINNYVPLSLIYIGIICILIAIIPSLQPRDKNSGCMILIITLLVMLVFSYVALSITSSVMTFIVQSTVKYEKHGDLTKYCNRSLYLYSYVISITNCISYGALAFLGYCYRVITVFKK